MVKVLLSQLLLNCVLSAAVTIATSHFDYTRSGWNNQEIILTPAKVSGGKFGLLGRYSLDGFVYTQPLYIPNVPVPGIVKRDLVIVATQHNSLYALDGQNPGSVIWRRNFGASLTNYPFLTDEPIMYNQEVGCKSTPAVDVALNFVFVTCPNTDPNWVLYKVNLLTGAIIAQKIVAAIVPGTGDPTTGFNQGVRDTASGGMLKFFPAQETAVTATSLINGRVFIGFGGYADIHPYHGWLMAYDENLNQLAVFCSTPSAAGGGMWMGASGGITTDGTYIYAVTGNGDWDGLSAWSMSVLKFNTSLQLIDWYTPNNWKSMNRLDSDLGSGSPMLVPGSTRIVTGSKDYRIFSTDIRCMGHLGGAVGNCTGAQVFFTNPKGKITSHSGVYNGVCAFGACYFANTKGKIYKFFFRSGSFDASSVRSSAIFEFPGAQMSASSNGPNDGIIWATTVSKSALLEEQPGTLRAFNPLDFSEYYNSDTRPADWLGTLSKYAAPTIVNGKVFVAAGNSVVAYGMLPTADARPGPISGPITLRQR